MNSVMHLSVYSRVITTTVHVKSDTSKMVQTDCLKIVHQRLRNIIFNNLSILE